MILCQVYLRFPASLYCCRFDFPLLAIQMPATAWKMIGRKIKVHSITGKRGKLWIENTLFWKTEAPPIKLALVIKWTHIYAPTGINPLSECKRRIKKSFFWRNDWEEAGITGKLIRKFLGQTASLGLAVEFGRMKIPSPLRYCRGYPSFNLEPSGNKSVGYRTSPLAYR